MTNWTDEDELRLSIDGSTEDREDGMYRRMVAEQIVAHLKRRTGSS